MARTHNFSAGPAALPTDVLAQAAEEMLDFQGSGMSVMEMSHRSKTFVDIAATAEQDLRDLFAISDDYHVLFLQGGATGQFASVPMNLTNPDDTIDFVDTGAWSKKAIKEAGKYCHVNVAASSSDSNYDHIPNADSWQLSDDATLLHVCSNETIGGVQFKEFPEHKTLVADMSSDILSRPVNIDDFGLIYAGAQKNIGPAGLTVIIVRKDLCGSARSITPTFLDYAVQADADSMSNTPPTYAWYLAGLVFKWVKANGGLAGMAAQNQAKADLLYNAIDASNFYSAPVALADRSIMNVPFTLADAALDADFLAQAEARGMFNLKGHRSVGGMRASIYNAVPMESVQALVTFMGEFENERG
ncbi:MAG: 3-phosphoserine/phosphohydroxythreonine transaminase [OM182 bacterium]|jgi:phosphoserine aminotransferase|nr:MAG: 3-phosphoserine/phosphohydroxythreonine transaminase [OM182 bacterium]